ncbi:MAG: N-acetylmuramoyl-L-alanine amidase [Clostridiales bacterium]|nr:N-acetylmuramoyl-L-alanine amidase [Clostridiales bacterium]
MIAILCFGMAFSTMDVEAASSTKVTVTYKGVSKTYSSKKTSAYVNNTKIGLKNQPIFKKKGWYYGPVNKLFKNSSLKVTVTSTSTKVTMQYGSNILVMKNGKKKVTLNGTTITMDVPAMYVTYSNGKSRWVVPLKLVCSYLDIDYSTSGGVIKIGGTTNSSSNSSSSNDGKVVLVLDAGHGGTDSGATGNGYREKTLNLAIVKAAKTYFDDDSRFKVYYTRTSDTYPSLSDRYNLANNVDADLFISVHINSASSSSATGTEVLYNSSRNSTTKKNGITSKKLATAILKSVVATTGFTNRGLKNRTDLAVLNHTTMPASLIEYGFISNSTEARKMNANTTRYGKELYEGIVDYLTSAGLIE